MKVLVWNENEHEKQEPIIEEIYPGRLHGYIANFLRSDDVEVSTATLDDPECGLTEEVLAETDVLIWWGHIAHKNVPDEVVERVHKHVLGGMGLIVLHSGHFSKIFKKLMGTTCSLKWRDHTRERVWTIMPNHPIAEGVDETFVLEDEEMYGEPFDIAKPDEVIFLSWFNGGEVFRSGCTWTRGHGKIFYFQPGHETNTAFQNANVQRIIKNAVKWACPVRKNIEIICPKFMPLENVEG
ncbi:MAG: ThuA domain-containing protein [Clostridia bacterium]|nr:ThuA domain-containing protein [Clostridia bacterium]